VTLAVPPNVRGGVLFADKPAGVTSFAVVNAVRKALVGAFPDLSGPPRRRGEPKPPRYKCGHAGTLDPLATGLLVVLVGKGSRLAQFLLGLDKTYTATVSLGRATDTLDADGQVVQTAAVPGEAALYEAALADFRGPIRQVPPLVSALKRDGQPLYKLVRSGQDVAAPAARQVTITRLEMPAARLGGSTPELDLVVGCSSGTYIRSLARDICERAGTVGHISALRRLAIGPFNLDEAVTDVMQRDGHDLAARLLPLTAALPHLPRLILTAAECAGIRQGGQPGRDWLWRLDRPLVYSRSAEALFQMLDAEGVLVAVGKLESETAEPRLIMGIPAMGIPLAEGEVGASDSSEQ